MPKDVGSSRSTPLVVDASGFAGAPGGAGRPGELACDGGHAGQPQSGEPGGVIDVYVSADPLQRVHIEGQQSGASGRTANIDLTLQSGNAAELRAEGGAGGAGGNGGSGGPGLAGGRGHDALAGAGPTPGQAGGQGGSGGLGTSGGAGGAGGEVRVQVPLQDMDLLAAVRPRVRGGQGGPAGSHGEGGPGGMGGAGGEGGSSGWFGGAAPLRRRGARGLAGQRPTQALVPGAMGANGRVSYVVQGMSTEAFAERFAFQLSHPRLRGSHGLGAPRPFFGDTLACTVNVTNTSQMPSPPENPLHVQMLPGEWVVPQQASRLPAGLSHNRTITTPPMQFSIPYPDEVGCGEPLVKRTELALQVVNPRINVPLEESLLRVPVEITHPVQLGVIEGDHVTEGDKPAQVHWQVRNLSDRTLGLDSEGGRGIRCVVRVEGDVPADKVMFRAPGSAPQGVPLQQALNQVVRRLHPGQVIDLRGEVYFAADVPKYAKSRLVVELHLDDAGSHADRLIQQRDFAVQLATQQLRDGRSELLLVVNESTTPEEVQAWEALAAELGTSLNTWSLGVYGDVALMRAVEGHRLANEYAGKTVVWLNNPFRTARGEDRATAHLSPEEFVAASQACGVSNYVVGPAGAFSLKDAVASAPARGPGQAHHSLHTFQAAAQEGSAGISQPEGSDTIEVRHRSAPTENVLRGEQETLAQWLREHHPQCTFKLSAFLQPSESRGESKKRYRVGRIHVTRGLDATARALVQNDMPPQQMHDPAGIMNDANRYGLCKALPFEAKLRALSRMLGDFDISGDPMFVQLRKALLSDIVEEQRVVRASNSVTLSYAEMGMRMERLRTLCQFDFGKPALCSFRWNALLELLGSVDGMMSANMTAAETSAYHWRTRANTIAYAWQQMSKRMTRRLFAEGSRADVAQSRREAAAVMMGELDTSDPLGHRFPGVVVAGVVADYEVRNPEVDVEDVTFVPGGWGDEDASVRPSDLSDDESEAA